MADLIRTAQYFKVQIADKPGHWPACLLRCVRPEGICWPCMRFPGVAAHRWMWCRKMSPRSRTSRRRIS